MGMARLIGISAALWIAATGLASAADMAGMPEIPAIDNTSIEPEFGSNWYLRGDIGYVMSKAKFDVGGVSASDDGSSWSGGIGGGYDFGWFRSDITFDYLADREVDLDVSGTDYNASFNAAPLLLNGYFDLGTWSGFTPYVGAGAGVALVTWNNWQIGSSTVGGVDDARFAWALMAGIDFSINPNLSIDLGYRFVDITHGEANRDGVDYEDLLSHEFRVGFRYLID